MKKDILAEKKIEYKEKNFDTYIQLRSNHIARAYCDCFSSDISSYKTSAIFAAIQVINLMGYEKGIEIGVSVGDSTITLLDLCKKLKTLYCVDNYKPYVDYYTENFKVDEYEINIVKNLAFKKIYNSVDSHKIIFFEEDSDITVDRFQDEELDFAFLDAHLNAEHIKNDLEKWYPKVRPGGLVIIHDTHFESVLEEINNFTKNINFDGEFSNMLDLCCLLKSK